MHLSAPSGRWSETLQKHHWTLQQKGLWQRTRANFLVLHHELLWCCYCSQPCCHMLRKEKTAQFNSEYTDQHMKPLRDRGNTDQCILSAGIHVDVILRRIWRLWCTCDPQIFLLCVRKVEDFTDKIISQMKEKPNVSALCHWNECGDHCAHVVITVQLTEGTRFTCLWMLTGLIQMTTWKWENRQIC